VAPEHFIGSIDRRTFLRILSFTGVTGLIYSRNVLSSMVPTISSRVVIVEDGSATSGSSIDEGTVQVMIDSGIKTLAQQDDVGGAWKTLLTDVDSSSVIAIKVNCRYSSMPTHPEVAYAVAEGLKRMEFGGTNFPENNIIIYDNWKAEFAQSGYDVNTSSTGVRCFDTDSTVGYSDESYNVNGSSQKLSRVITEMADYLINISVLKNHGTVSGVTLCLKNHFGTCNEPSSMHGNHGDPYIPALNALSAISGKQRVSICDALFGIYSGGPGGVPQFVANKIILSHDIVVVDYWGREILEERGCTTISQAHHIDTAAEAPYNLGTNDPSEMDVINITDPTSCINSHTNPDNVILRQNNPNPFNGHTQIQFYVPRPVPINLSIFDTAGRRVRGLLIGVLHAGWHNVPWDGCNDLGGKVASGLYVCQVKTASFRKAIIMQLRG